MIIVSELPQDNKKYDLVLMPKSLKKVVEAGDVVLVLQYEGINDVYITESVEEVDKDGKVWVYRGDYDSAILEGEILAIIR